MKYGSFQADAFPNSLFHSSAIEQLNSSPVIPAQDAVSSGPRMSLEHGVMDSSD